MNGKNVSKVPAVVLSRRPRRRLRLDSLTWLAMVAVVAALCLTNIMVGRKLAADQNRPQQTASGPTAYALGGS